MTVDETEVVARLLRDRTGRSHIMLDVGAHFGTSASYFDALGWTIHCFEPDPNNRAKLAQRFGTKPNVTIDIRAVSDVPAKGVTFFQSDESTGISGLHAFRDTHRAAGEVDVTTINEVTQDLALDRIDFLKIDVEGFDFSVLKGVPWDRLRPDAIECEFEDRKTLPLGYTYKEMAQFLLDKGYSIYLSEWHPIIRYGIRHDWYRLVRFPGTDLSPDAWGNILAFKTDPGLAAVSRAFDEAIAAKNPGAANRQLSPSSNRSENASTAAVLPKSGEIYHLKQSASAAVAVEKPVVANRQVNPTSNRSEGASAAAAPDLGETHQQKQRELPVVSALVQGSRLPTASNYERFVLWARGNSPLVYQIGRLVMWALRVSRRHAGMVLALGAVLAGLVIGGFLVPNGPGAISLWILAAMLAVSGLVIAGAGYARHLIRREMNAVKIKLGALEAQSRSAARGIDAHKSKLGALEVQLRSANGGADATRAKLIALEETTKTKLKTTEDITATKIKEMEDTTAAKLTAVKTSAATKLKELEDNLKTNFEKLEANILSATRNTETTKTKLRGMELELHNTVRNLEVRNRADGTKLRAEMQKQRHTMQKASEFNNVFFQQFSRTLEKEQIQTFRLQWARSLGLDLKDTRIGYLAHRACLLENQMKGRLATGVETIVLRSLVATAVKRKDISILEIGTLFGIGAAAIYEAATDVNEDVHLTVIDPLDGYYGPGNPDILTGARVDEKTLRQNWSRASIPEENYTIIKHFTTDKTAIEAARQRQYDLLVIDGDHSFEGVKFDFEHYAPMVRPGGYILFDDYDVRDWPDIKVYVDAEISPRDDLDLVGAGFRTAVFQVKRTVDIEAGASGGRESR